MTQNDIVEREVAEVRAQVRALVEPTMGTNMHVSWKEIDQIVVTALTRAYQAGMEAKGEEVVCAAVMAEDGTIYRGHRHGHAMQACRDEGKNLFKGLEQQGFVTSRNRYVSREEARRLQEEAGKPSADDEGYRGSTLYSEDLYQPTKDVLITPTTPSDVTSEQPR